jgi:hypothetical protein
VCGWGNRSSIEPLLRLKKDSEFYAEYVAESRPEEIAPDRVYEPVSLPAEFRSLSVTYRSPWYGQAIQYLTRRGLGHSEIVRYKLGYAEDGPYRNRIIIPSFDRYGELNFVVGRSIYDSDMKYKHGRYDKDIIFNDYMIDWSRPVTLVEGPFDMMKAGSNAIPIMGVFLNPQSKLFQRIVERSSSVYLALDNDVPHNVLRISEDMIRHGVEVRVISWRGFKDPGDMPLGMLESLKPAASRIDSSMDILKYRAFASGTRAWSL